MLTNTQTEDSIINGILLHGLSILPNCLVSNEIANNYHKLVSNEWLEYPQLLTINSIGEWNIPQKYKEFDIENFCISLAGTTAEKERVLKELSLYKSNNMIMVLKAMKYIVDTLRENNVVWGVGRGSSVASYVLFLIGVHKIDSIKYDIPINEFFK